MSRWVMQISILITLATESGYSLMIHRLGSDLDKEARINMTTCLSGIKFYNMHNLYYCETIIYF